MRATRNARLWTTTLIIAAAIGAVFALAFAALERNGDDAPGGPAADGTASKSAENGKAPSGNAENSGGSVDVVSVDGRTISVPSDRPTVLYFMASWCSSCIEQARALNELEEDYAGAAQFVGVDVTPGATREEVESFRQHAGGPEHPYVVDDGRQFVERYDIMSIDSTVVVGSDGKVLARVDAKPMNAAALREFLDAAIQRDGDGGSEPTPEPALAG
jgi:thiol-disulfide isomerase/thioredoxin